MASLPPTPWTAERTGGSVIHIISRSGGVSPQVVAIANSNDPDAVAALICAAPDLLAAIRASDLPAAQAIVAALDIEL